MVPAGWRQTDLRIVRLFSMSLLVFLMGVTVALAVKPSALPGVTAPLPGTSEAVSDDPLGRSTPQGAALGFMRAMDKEDYERAVEYLDTKQSPKRAEQLAVELHFIIDRGLSRDLNNLSRKPEGDLSDGLSPDRQRVGIVKAGSLSIDIQLQRVNREGEPPLWLFSADTLRQVPLVYEQLDVPLVDRYVPAVLTQTRYLLCLFVALDGISGHPSPPLSFVEARGPFVLSPAAHGGAPAFTGDDEGRLESVRSPFNLFILALAFYAYAPLSGSALGRFFWDRMAVTVTVVSLAWLAIRVIDVVVRRTVTSRRTTAVSGRIAIARLAGQFCKGLALVAGAAIILYDMGINLTAVLAGLGVGGIAVAFAAQKTLENLFGGIMIASDQPIRVGDFCRAGEYSGVVENIGLRSTRIRTMDRTMVSVPNGQLSVMSLENFAMRDKIRFDHKVGLRSDTTADQLRQVLTEVDRMVHEHAGVEGASARVRLIGIRNNAFELELFAYVPAPSFEDFLEIQEDMLLRLIDIVEAAGAAFASPV